MTPKIKRQVWAWIRGASLGLIGYAAIVPLAAGRWDWLWGWVYIGLLAAALAAHPIVLVPINPALLADRSRGMRQPGAKRWDVALVMLASVCLIAITIVGGLDARFGWSGNVALWVHLVGVALFVVGWAIFLWAMACNPFFSEAVRIQEGHRVAERGPYRAVRHPGYAGACLGLVAQPLLLGSWPAWIPAILAVAAYAVRTALEDRTLQAELPGYGAYAQRTRYRLLPGVW
ncbi:MAG: isoprenylcysteine carboxylmethyltransferase family protein [Chloroflexi bacterium]|nr:isoprenylcysteine carboxylmethyltransferase family protein [Chloroflexota bacterium]